MENMNIKKTMCNSTPNGGVCDRHLFLGCSEIKSSISDKIKLDFDEIIKKIKKIDFGKIDSVVAISRGGIVPGALIANLLNVDFHIININFRDDCHKEKYEAPRLLGKIDFNFINKNILLVDDVSRTGKTLNFAKDLLKTNVKTFVINGIADYSLYNYKECLIFPWN